MSRPGPRQARDELVRLLARGCDLVPFWLRAGEIVASVVPHY